MHLRKHDILRDIQRQVMIKKMPRELNAATVNTVDPFFVTRNVLHLHQEEVTAFANGNCTNVKRNKKQTCWVHYVLVLSVKVVVVVNRLFPGPVH